MTPKDVSAIIATSKPTFVLITGKTTDDYILRLREFITPILLGINYDTSNGAHNLWGVLSTNAAYITRYKTAFVSPTWTSI